MPGDHPSWWARKPWVPWVGGRSLASPEAPSLTSLPVFPTDTPFVYREAEVWKVRVDGGGRGKALVCPQGLRRLPGLPLLLLG